MLLCSQKNVVLRDVAYGRVLRMWPCSPTLTSRATASSRGTATAPGTGSSRAMGSRATGSSRAMAGSLRATMAGSLTVAPTEEATSLLATLHKVGASAVLMCLAGPLLMHP